MIQVIEIWTNEANAIEEGNDGRSSSFQEFY